MSGPQIDMDGNIERECSALGGLFQQIITDMKVCIVCRILCPSLKAHLGPPRPTLYSYVHANAHENILNLKATSLLFSVM